jgi:hypothetical protein
MQRVFLLREKMCPAGYEKWVRMKRTFWM